MNQQSFDDVLKYAVANITGCSEAYEVVHTSHLWKNHHEYRFEVVRDVMTSPAKYCVRAYFKHKDTWVCTGLNSHGLTAKLRRELWGKRSVSLENVVSMGSRTKFEITSTGPSQ